MSTSDKRTFSLDDRVLERARRARGWSIEQLAEAAGLSTRTLSRLLNGAPVYMKTATLIAGALGVEVSALLKSPIDVQLPGTTTQRENGLYLFSITTVGFIDSPEHMKLLSEITQEMIARLKSQGHHLEIYLHETNLRSLEGRQAFPAALVRLEAPTADLKKCVWGPFHGNLHRTFTYTVLPLAEYDRLINSTSLNEACSSFAFEYRGPVGTRILSGQVFNDEEQREMQRAINTYILSGGDQLPSWQPE